MLAMRNLPTTKWAMLCASWPRAWDGQDRWYLEALGLALEKRESDFLSSFLTARLYGELDLEWQARAAMSHSRHISRSTATRHSSRPAHPGACHRPSARIWGWRGGSIAARYFRCSSASAPIASARAATGRRRHSGTDEGAGDRGAGGGRGGRVEDSVHRQKMLVMLARRLAGRGMRLTRGRRSFKSSNGRWLIPQRASKEWHWRPRREMVVIGDIRSPRRGRKAPEEVRVAAVDAIGSFQVTPNRVLEQLVASVRGKPSSNVVAEAAVRAMADRRATGPGWPRS